MHQVIGQILVGGEDLEVVRAEYVDGEAAEQEQAEEGQALPGSQSGNLSNRIRRFDLSAHVFLDFTNVARLRKFALCSSHKL